MYNLSGGLQSTLAGGNFKSGFLSGGISSTLGSLTAGWGDAGQLFTGIAGGGIGSVIGGGSFIDGAQMGAITVGLNHLAEKSTAGLQKKVIKRLTLRMANRHYRSGNGEPLLVEASNVDLTFVDSDLFQNRRSKTVNLLGKSRDGLVYGKLDLEYKGNNRVEIKSNRYDFDTGAAKRHPWVGKNSQFFRNVFTKVGNINAGSGTPYMINFHGLGIINNQIRPTLKLEFIH